MKPLPIRIPSKFLLDGVDGIRALRYGLLDSIAALDPLLPATPATNGNRVL